MDTYHLIIASSLIIILSFLFNVISKRTNIPSVLLLMGLGVALNYTFHLQHSEHMETLSRFLPLLGNVGLIMIVLEAALDLKLSKDKFPIIWKSFSVALLALTGSSLGIAYVIQYFFESPFSSALLYAIPLSIMSSAIIIPSVGGLIENKKEFMVYESTFSDILGIMFFYFLIGYSDVESSREIVFGILGNILLTVVMSIIIAYSLVLIFQNLKTQVKLFLIIAVLMLLYAVGKIFHLSSLISILVFGLVLNNTKTFFAWKLKKFINEKTLQPILHDFHTLTLESAFVIRSFFFVVFGITITLTSLYNWRVVVISLLIIGILFTVRYVFLKLFLLRDIVPQLFIAPRGLITVLLFFSIPDGILDNGTHNPSGDFTIAGFDPGILLFTILGTSLIMTVSLIMNKGGAKNVPEAILEAFPLNLGKKEHSDEQQSIDHSMDQVIQQEKNSSNSEDSPLSEDDKS